MKTKNHGILNILIKIQFHHKTLNLTNINPLTYWQVFISVKLNLNMNVTLIHNFMIIPKFESILTSVSLPKLDPFFELTLILVSIDFEIEPPLLDSHISLMGKECEIEFFDLDSTLELKLTLEPKVDFFELVLVLEPIILEPKSAIPPTLDRQ